MGDDPGMNNPRIIVVKTDLTTPFRDLVGTFARKISLSDSCSYLVAMFTMRQCCRRAAL